ncbi:MAG TPA: response regulator [Polyangiaceae bacterium]|nr:response regulator [Polyangiaceae bacterium]
MSGEKLTILFVDDEQALLNGLRDALRRFRRQWVMVFALGPEAALAELDRLQFDAVVSDMRMPGIDGATFLAIVKERQPGAARLVLSGHADPELIARAYTVAHDFLQKPCDPETLSQAILRASRVEGSSAEGSE